VFPELDAFLRWQSADTWLAVWTFILIFATLAIAGATLYLAHTVQGQIRSSREENAFQIESAQTENRATQTLEACGRYDTDPVIYACQKKLVRIKGGKKRDDAALKANSLLIRQEALIVLNFLDAIAIGVQQKLYIEDLARAHLINIVRKHVAEFIDSGFLEAIDCPRSSYDTLIALDNKWQSHGGELCQNPSKVTA
jgi:hypothetical protein